MEKFIKISTVIFILSVIFISCSKNEPESLLSTENLIEKVSVKTVISVDEKFKNFDNFLKSESYQILKANIADFRIESIQAVSFDKNSVLGFIVKINDSNGYCRNLMSVYNIDDPENSLHYYEKIMLKIPMEK